MNINLVSSLLFFTTKGGQPDAPERQQPRPGADLLRQLLQENPRLFLCLVLLGLGHDARYETRLEVVRQVGGVRVVGMVVVVAVRVRLMRVRVGVAAAGGGARSPG